MWWDSRVLANVSFSLLLQLFRCHSRKGVLYFSSWFCFESGTYQIDLLCGKAFSPICNTLRDFLPFVQFKNLKNEWMSVTFTLRSTSLLKVTLLHSVFHFLKLCNGTKSRKKSHIWKLNAINQANRLGLITPMFFIVPQPKSSRKLLVAILSFFFISKLDR